jgi:hypothetical protein
MPVDSDDADQHQELVQSLKRQIEEKKQRNRDLSGGFDAAPFARDSDPETEAVWARDDATRSSIDKELMKCNLERDQVRSSAVVFRMLS